MGDLAIQITDGTFVWDVDEQNGDEDSASTDDVNTADELVPTLTASSLDGVGVITKSSYCNIATISRDVVSRVTVS